MSPTNGRSCENKTPAAKAGGIEFFTRQFGSYQLEGVFKQVRQRFLHTASTKMSRKRKQLLRGREAPLPTMGVFLIRNMLNDRVLVVAGVNLEGTINKHKFQLAAGIHPNVCLQADWNETSVSNFTFEIVDQLTPVGDASIDHADLKSLLHLWLERLKPFADRGYNEPVISRGQMLSRISARRVKQ